MICYVREISIGIKDGIKINTKLMDMLCKQRDVYINRDQGLYKDKHLVTRYVV